MSEFNKLLAKKILTRAHDFEWSLQGLGMFRLYLSEEVRLHVWDHRFVVDNVSTIHDHPWHFASMVVSGRVVDQMYEIDDGYQTHLMQKIFCGEGGGPVGDPVPVRLRQLSPDVVNEGCVYHRQASMLHESFPDDGTVTICERKFLTDPDHAKVFFPAGTEWVSAEPRMATDREVVAMATRALFRMNGGDDS